MSTKQEFVSLVEVAVGGRLYPQTAPDGTPLPYATWAQVGGPSQTYLEGVESEKEGARIQINVWDKDDMKADAIMRQVSDIAIAKPICGEPQGAASMAHTVKPNLRGMKRDFIIWFDRL